VVDLDAAGQVSRYRVPEASRAMSQQASASPAGVEVRVVP
jgi:hypothetical protein